MKVICEHCGLEILENEFKVADHMTFHTDDCLNEYLYQQYVTDYTKKEYDREYRRLSE